MSSKADLANKLFPLGIATGTSFCNREKEKDRLKSNIVQGTHTYITGMRRYGKTSLVRQVTKELDRQRSPKVHSLGIDLLTVHNVEALDALLRKAVGTLSGQFLPKNRKIIGQLGKIFASFKPEMTVGNNGFSIRFFGQKASAQSIQQLLEGLDQAAVHYKRRAVLIIDEFQQIAQIDKDRTIEGAIRNVAQRSKGLSIVFLGSERSALLQMFDRKRPMYNAASEHMELGRITAEKYGSFLQNAARLRWSKPLSENTVDTLLSLTDRHSYYVNVLCRDVWRNSRLPSARAVTKIWEEVLKRDRHQAYSEIRSLTNTQRSVLQAIATERTNQPTSRDYLVKFGIAGSTMKTSLDVLIEQDFVRVTSDGNHEVVDPLIKGIMIA